MTNTYADINIEVDESINNRASDILDSMGLDVKTAVNMFLRQIVAEEALPFQPFARYSMPMSDDELSRLILDSGIPVVDLTQVDENGYVIIDKEKHPEVYDWVVNG